MQIATAISRSTQWISHLSGRVTSAICAGLLLLSVAGVVLGYGQSLDSQQTIAGLRLGQADVGALPLSELEGVVAREARRQLEQPITLQIGKTSLPVKGRLLGAMADQQTTLARLRAVGKSGQLLQDLRLRVAARRHGLVIPLVTRLDRQTALDFFTGLKERVDRTPVEARLDLDKGIVAPGAVGYRLPVFDSMAAVELALHRGQRTVRLPVTVRQPSGTSQRLEGLDISAVLGKFSTAYSLKLKYKDRGHNLQVGASKLDGVVLAPGQTLSYNEAVGPRTEAHGYRMAPVINQGELVDGMAGGSCQLSSTLFAAAFFGGLDLVNSRPHTRPSSYIKMGLDATVAYPVTDMQIRNPYPFEVVIHFKVNQGRVQVRLLGKQRPWSKVVFEREVKETKPFTSVERKDPKIPTGKRLVSQRGVPGFVLERRRLLFKGRGKEPTKVERRILRYPATTEYVRVGTGPADPNWEPPRKPPEPFGEVAPEFSLAQ